MKADCGWLTDITQSEDIGARPESVSRSSLGRNVGYSGGPIDVDGLMDEGYRLLWASAEDSMADSRVTRVLRVANQKRQLAHHGTTNSAIKLSPL